MKDLTDIATLEFSDIAVSVEARDEGKLRIHLIDGSFVELWFSLRRSGIYAYHWERRHVDGTVHRHNNIPHSRWKHVATFPKHYHAGEEEYVIESNLPDDPIQALREILTFCRTVLLGT